MTVPARLCPITGEPLTDDRYVSRTACATLRGLLTDLRGLMGDLEGAVGKQLRFGEKVGGRSPATGALPFAYSASEAEWVARMTLLTWVDWVAAVRGHTTPDRWSYIGVYLVGSLTWLAAHPDGPQAIDEMIAALRQARRAVDRPQERRFAGVCGADRVLLVTTMADEDPAHVTAPCTQALYAPAGATAIVCPACDTEHDVDARRDLMLTQLRDVVLTATELSRAIDGLGVDVTPARIWQWRRRGLLVPAATTPAGAPMYRVGDALDLVNGCTALRSAS